MTGYQCEYQKWISYEGLDKELREELEAISGSEKEIEERFSMPLAFGTGGLRGIIRAGINGMNIYTVAQATQGLSELIIREGGAEMGVVIASDTRIKSDVFSEISASTPARQHATASARTLVHWCQDSQVLRKSAGNRIL